MKKTFEINYVYFIALFVCLLGVHGYSLIVLKDVALFPFFISIVFQCLLEALLLLMMGLIIHEYLPKFFFQVFVALSCILMLAHEVDFIMIRLMGVTIWYLLHLISIEMGDNFFEMIKATNISPMTWILGSFGVITVFFVGMAFFHLSHRLSSKKKIHLSLKTVGFMVAVSLIATFAWDKMTLNRLSYVTYEQFRQILPLKHSFFTPSKFLISIESSLKAVEVGRVKKEVKTEEKAPPIFLFVIESLREDFITKEVSPNLFQFKQDHISFDLAASGGNASHISWFTLFHSQLPLRFSKEYVSKTIETGSLALKAFKDLGYQIHLYTSAELAFYQMGESIFGKNYHLADTVYAATHKSGVTPAERDQQVMLALEKDERVFSGEKHLFIVFLDATHFGYSWLPKNEARFVPIDEPIDYIKAAFNQGSLEGIKNRYRNSIFYVDELLGKLLKAHENDDATIVITGDHGEEFYEHGQLFHASNLSQEQIHVPLYYKFGKETSKLQAKAVKISSHIDIFPTLIDYVQGDFSHLEGESIFNSSKWPFTLTARYNGGKKPVEFCLQNLAAKAIFQSHIPKALQIAEISHPEHITSFQEALSHLFE